MRKFVLTCAVLLQAACQTALGNGDEPPVPSPLPPAVARALPADVPVSAVGFQDRCFLYDAPDGSVVFMRDEEGRQICLGE